MPNGPISFDLSDDTIKKVLKQYGYKNGVYWYSFGYLRIGTLLAKTWSGGFHAIDLTHHAEDPLFECVDGKWKNDRIEGEFTNIQGVLDSQNSDLVYMAKKYIELLEKEKLI